MINTTTTLPYAFSKKFAGAGPASRQTHPGAKGSLREGSDHVHALAAAPTARQPILAYTLGDRKTLNATGSPCSPTAGWSDRPAPAWGQVEPDLRAGLVYAACCQQVTLTG